MPQCYIELRRSAARGTDSIAADMMRHLHTRQHLGRAVIVSEQPVPMLSAARKQWLKLSRTLQKQRSSTLNADKILKYTHTITHMQHMSFSCKSPLDHPEADVHFLHPALLKVIPPQCLTVYVLCPIASGAATNLITQLPASALVVDYEQSPMWRQTLSLTPKAELEEDVRRVWGQVLHFLQTYNIYISAIILPHTRNMDALDDALDTLLTVSHRFLQIAGEFQRALELARPLRLTKDVREQYDTLVLLAHRVQALSPRAFSTQFLQTYNEDDTFFLQDITNGQGPEGEPLAISIARHHEAGRHTLAQALRSLKMRPAAHHATNPQPPGRLTDRSSGADGRTEMPLSATQ